MTTQQPSNVDISTPRTIAACVLLGTGVVGGLVSADFMEEDAPLLIAAATGFVIVEVIAKVLEFILNGNDDPDWFATKFEPVRIATALVAGSFVAANQAAAHAIPAVIGLLVLILVLVIVRMFRPR